eukprot:2612905-Alexandrium_andersonii.AAC.1
MNHWPCDRAGHLLEPGHCRYGGVAGRNLGPRRGRRPRTPVPPPVQEPTAGLPCTARIEDGSRRELGADAEDEALRQAAAREDNHEAPQAGGRTADRQ